jgi:hypothetical protein
MGQPSLTSEPAFQLGQVLQKPMISDSWPHSSGSLVNLSSSLHLRIKLAPCYIPAMDLRAIRIKNLQVLAKEFGGLDLLADKCETSYDTLYQVIKGYPLKSGAPRGLGPNLQRKIEEKTGRPAGWMDRDHDAVNLSPGALIFAKWYDALPADAQRRMLDVGRAVTGVPISSEEVERRMPITKTTNAKR